MPPLQRYVVALTGGLQDSTPVPNPSDLSELYNFALFRGRFALRAPLTEVVDITTVTAAVTDVLAFEPHQNKIFIVSWSSSSEIVYLHSMDFDGTGLALETNIWTSVTTKPKVIMSSFGGGTADDPEDRLFISDYDQGHDTVYWNDTGSSLTTIEEDWNADTSVTAGRFSLVAPYQFHLWGTGFYTQTTAAKRRPEMLRFSQPGLVPGTDPAGGTPATKEWFSFDHRSVGRRGDKITAISYARGNMIVFQSRSTHAIFGYGERSWATKMVSDRTGCAGPYAATATDADGLCFFWSHDGPYMTDGSVVTFIGDPIRQRIIDVGSDDTVTTSYSPDDGLVYFIVIPDSGDSPSYYLAYDTKREKWSDGAWLDSAGADLEVQFSQTISPRGITVPGPEGIPTIGTATALDDDRIILTWTNADLALGTTTEIYRDTSTAPTTLIATAETGVTEYEDSGLDPRTTYYYRVFHVRNNIGTGWSGEVSAKTWCEPPSAVFGGSVATGNKVKIAFTLANAEVRIERRNAENDNWGVVTTLTNQTPPVASHDDTTVTCGRRYVYRARLEETSETPSTWVEGNEMIACYQGGQAPAFTVTEPIIVDLNKGYAYVSFTFTRDNFAETDELRIYRRGAGGSYPADEDPTAILTGNGDVTWNDAPWQCPNTLGTTQWRFEIWAHGKDMVSGSDIEKPVTPANPCSGMVL